MCAGIIMKLSLKIEQIVQIILFSGETERTGKKRGGRKAERSRGAD